MSLAESVASIILDFILVGISWCYVLLAQYTKVEESFNLHATHDVLMYGVQPHALQNYDHFVFPGAVSRTFIGSLLLAWLSGRAVDVASALGLLSEKFDIQIVVRLVLATVNALAICLVRRGVSRRFGFVTSAVFVLLSCTQFHIPFWMGRTLPNMFALFPVNIAFYLLLNHAPSARRPSQSSTHGAIALLIFAAAVFRSELVLLLAPLGLQALFCHYTKFERLSRVGLVAGICSAALTIAVDSYFWQVWLLWPELNGLYFNVIEGKSSEWGVSPFHTYFTSHLPKLLLSSLPLSLLGFLLDSRIRALLLPSLIFLILISGLGHKEWRFIVYVVPVFNVAAARGATWLVLRRKCGLFGQIAFFSVACFLTFNALATLLLSRASMANYPGGVALSEFNNLYASQDYVHVHISNLAAQTGASLFLHTHAPPYFQGIDIAPSTPHWTYNKTEHLSPEILTAAREITHVIAESADAAAFASSSWRAIDVVPGFDKWTLHTDLRTALQGGIKGIKFLGLRMILSEKLVILERIGQE